MSIAKTNVICLYNRWKLWDDTWFPSAFIVVALVYSIIVGASRKNRSDGCFLWSTKNHPLFLETYRIFQTKDGNLWHCYLVLEITKRRIKSPFKSESSFELVRDERLSIQWYLENQTMGTSVTLMFFWNLLPTNQEMYRRYITKRPMWYSWLREGLNWSDSFASAALLYSEPSPGSDRGTHNERSKNEEATIAFYSFRSCGETNWGRLTSATELFTMSVWEEQTVE